MAGNYAPENTRHTRAQNITPDRLARGARAWLATHTVPTVCKEARSRLILTTIRTGGLCETGQKRGPRTVGAGGKMKLALFSPVPPVSCPPQPLPTHTRTHARARARTHPCACCFSHMCAHTHAP